MSTTMQRSANPTLNIAIITASLVGIALLQRTARQHALALGMPAAALPILATGPAIALHGRHGS